MATIHSPQNQESIEHLWSTWKSIITDYTDILVWWEMVKYKIKQLTIETSRAINLSKSTVEKYEKRINKMKDSNKYLNKNEVNDLQRIVKEFYENQTNAVKIRSRIKYYEEGKKSTKFFLNTEKRNASAKTWNKIKCSDGTYKTDIHVHLILNEQVMFYQTLFTSNGYSNIDVEYFLQNINIKLTEQERLHYDRDAAEGEILNVIKQLKLNKSPGDDGIVSEFYVTYWPLIKQEFTQVVKHILVSHTLAPSQYRAMLTLLYKKVKTRIFQTGDLSHCLIFNIIRRMHYYYSKKNNCISLYRRHLLKKLTS